MHCRDCREVVTKAGLTVLIRLLHPKTNSHH